MTANITTLKVYKEDAELVNSIRLQISAKANKEKANADAFHLIVQEWRQLRNTKPKEV